MWCENGIKTCRFDLIVNIHILIVICYLVDEPIVVVFHQTPMPKLGFYSTLLSMGMMQCWRNADVADSIVYPFYCLMGFCLISRTRISASNPPQPFLIKKETTFPNQQDHLSIYLSKLKQKIVLSYYCLTFSSPGVMKT